jgi:Zn-dependent peptidase ImmA (M78 family)
LNTTAPNFEQGDIVTNGGARVTLAHELCHLLLDGDHPLSAVEVLRSRMPAGVEARARAFAGEFLLPTSAASYAWQSKGLPFDTASLQALLQDLAAIFGVTFSVAAWKVEHGAGADRHRLRAALDAIAPYR